MGTAAAARLRRLLASDGARDAGLAAAFAGLGALWAWLGTAPALDVFVNWDTGVYLYGYASGQGSWQDLPWNCHFGVGHLYDPAVRLARALGATPLEGLRLLNAAAFAGASAVMADGLRRAVGGRAMAALLALVWMTAFTTQLSVLTLEDDVIYFPAAAVVVWLLLVRLEHWGWRDSLAGGVAVGFAALMSWQAAVYLGPVVYAAAVMGRRERSLAMRARDAAVLVAAFAAFTVGWALVVAALSPARGAGELLAVLTSRPEPSLFPHDLAGLVDMLARVGAMLGTLGTALCRMLRPWAALPGQTTLVVLGGLGVAGLVALVAWSCARGRLRVPVGRRLHAAAASLLLLAVVTSYYQIAEGDNLKRYGFVPFLLVAVVAAALPARWRPGIGYSPRAATAVMALLAAVALAQLGITVRWQRVTLRTPASAKATWVKAQHPSPVVTAEGQTSWYAYLRQVRAQRPDACQFVFSVHEMPSGQWWAEIPALLWSELPAHVVIAEPEERQGWKRAPRFVTRGELEGRPGGLDCAWVSAAAARLLGRR